MDVLSLFHFSLKEGILAPEIGWAGGHVNFPIISRYQRNYFSSSERSAVFTNVRTICTIRKLGCAHQLLNRRKYDELSEDDLLLACRSRTAVYEPE